MPRPTRPLVGLALLLTLGGCGAPGGPGADDGPDGSSWTRIADPPLSPRSGPVTAYVAGLVVVLGGDIGRPCPPTADCAGPVTYASDGAVYDPAGDGWTPLTPAPRPVEALAPRAVVGDRLYVLSDDRLIAWDASADSWAEIETPDLQGAGMVADGPRLVFASGSDEYGARPDRVLDTRSGAWSELPDDPLGRSFDRVVTPTDAGLVLTAKRIEADGGPADPALVRAALLGENGTWQRVPLGDQIGGWRWSWTGERLVDPTLGGADGGETNGYGRVIPYGGRLDPGTGTWSRLPEAPAEGSGGWPVEAAAGHLVASQGWVYDDFRERWTRLDRPAGAPTTPGPGVWVGEDLLVVGGTEWDGVDVSGGRTADQVYSPHAWLRRSASSSSSTGSPVTG